MKDKINWIAVPLIPLTLLAVFWEWWHFGGSQWILRKCRQYREWLDGRTINQPPKGEI